MNIDTNGIVLKQIKTANDRRIITFFSQKYGKIQAGANSFSGGKNKTSLSLKPFTLGRYQLYKSRDFYNVNSAETIKSYFGIGEDIDKYMYCSYVLEFTDKLLAEEQPMPRLFTLLTEFLQIMEKRKKEFLFLVVAYQLKAMKLSGVMPELKKCVVCGEPPENMVFSIKDGGVVCKKCCKEEMLIYPIYSDIINIIKYIEVSPFESLEKLSADEKVLDLLFEIVRKYCEYHLDIHSLKSEQFLKK